MSSPKAIHLNGQSKLESPSLLTILLVHRLDCCRCLRRLLGLWQNRIVHSKYFGEVVLCLIPFCRYPPLCIHNTNTGARHETQFWKFSNLSLLLFFFFFLPHWAWRILVPPRIKLMPPAVEIQNPNHSTTREFPLLSLFKIETLKMYVLYFLFF